MGPRTGFRPEGVWPHRPGPWIAVHTVVMASSTNDLEKLLHGVAHISSAVNEPVSIPALLNLVAEMACELLGFDFCGVFLPDKKGKVLVVEGSHGFTPTYIAEVNALHPITLREGEAQAPSTRAFLTRRSVQVTDTATDPSFAPWGAGAKALGFTSMIAVPLLVSSQALGTLNGYTSDAHEFTREEVDLATTLANQAAIAIASARLRASQARTIENLRVLNRSLEEQHALQAQAADIHQRLTTVALQEGGVTGVAEVLSDLLERDVRVQEAGGRWLASVAIGTGVVEPPEDVETGAVPFPEGSSAGPERERLADVSLHGADWVVAPVWLGGELAARVWVAGSVHDLRPLDRRAIEHSATVLALELLRLRTAMEVEWRTAADLVRDLINGDTADAAALRPRAERLGHDLDHPHHVMVVQADTDPEALGSSMVSSVRSVAATIQPRPLVATAGTLVVALWPELDPGEVVAAADAIRARLRRARPENTVSVTVTPSSRALHEYARSYRLGRGLAQLAHRRRVADTTLQIGDQGPVSLLLQIEQADELVVFSDQVLGPLRDYDQRRGAALVQTLAAYYRNNLNTAATAAELHVHPNTVGLRTRRAEELLELSLTDVDTVIHIGLALMCDEVVEVTSEPEDL